MSAASEIGADALGRLRTRVAEAEPARRAEILLLGLADAVKATSNDQNVQGLARALRASVADLVAAVSRP